MSDVPKWPEGVQFTSGPTPGSVRIVATSPSPMDARAEVLQRDGTWLPLRLCAITTHLDAQKMNTATIVVEPSSIDMIAVLDSYDVARVEVERVPSGHDVYRQVVKELRAYASSTYGANAKLSDVLDSL